MIDDHERWSAANRRPVMYAPGTFHVEPRCVCRRNARFYSVRCPDVSSHGTWRDLAWYDVPPVWEEPYMASARDYHLWYVAGLPTPTVRGTVISPDEGV